MQRTRCMRYQFRLRYRALPCVAGCDGPAPRFSRRRARDMRSREARRCRLAGQVTLCSGETADQTGVEIVRSAERFDEHENSK